MDCSPRAVIYRPRELLPPIDAASSHGSAPVNPFCGGAPIREWSSTSTRVSRFALVAQAREARRVQVRVDTAFSDVIENCATMLPSRPMGARITPPVIAAY